MSRIAARSVKCAVRLTMIALSNLLKKANPARAGDAKPEVSGFGSR